MGNFLDKIGLQHFVEKIKSLLSGYLPLSGGTMTGAIKYGTSEQDNDLITLTKNGLTSTKHLKNNALNYESSISPILLDLACQGENTEFGEVRQGSSSSLSFSGLSINVLSDKKSGSAYLTSTGCAAKKFTLSVNDSSITQKGLIANDSETVVKELSTYDVSDIFRKNSASFITGKHYLSETGLSAVPQAMYNKISKTIIRTNADTVVYPGYIASINVSAYTNFCIDTSSWSIDDSEVITFMRCKGFVDISNFAGLKYIHTFDARNSYLLNDSLDYLFADCEYLNIVEISDWNTDIVTSCSSMFQGCTAITSLFLDMWDTRNITDTSYMFYNCSRIDTINLDGWNTQSVKTMANMFTACSQLTDLTLGPGFGRMKDSVGTLDLSALTKWTGSTVQTLLDLYDRKANGMGVITIKLSSATKEALGTSGIQTLTAKGYTIA